MIAIELFCCSGGMAEGFRRAGITFDFAFDADPNACSSYEHNLGQRPVQMDVCDLIRLVEQGWFPAAGIDLLVADPPCTPWSRAGKRRGLEDPRDMLRETVQLIQALRPASYLIGNVPGLDDSTNWPIVQSVIGGLTAWGYCVADFRALDAADYGVPQHRVRPFWFGHRFGPCIRWPEPTHGAPSRVLPLPGVPALRPHVTVRDALGHLPAEDLGKPIRLRWRECNSKQHGSVQDRPARVVGTSNLSDGNVLLTGPHHRPSTADRPARTLTRNTHSDGALLVNDKHPINRADEPSFTISTKGDGRGAQGACVVAWPWDRPATTVTTTDRIGPPCHHEGSYLSGPQAIKLSERAAMILQGFPDGWHIAGKTKEARWDQIGMAMPPPLAEAVARSIVARDARGSEAAE